MKRIELALNLALIAVGVLLFSASVTTLAVPERDTAFDQSLDMDASDAAMAALPVVSVTPSSEEGLPAPPAVTPARSPSPIASAVTAAPKAPPQAAPANTPRPTATLPPLPGTVNVVLLGSDRRPGQSDWRTDVIIVVMVDPKNKRAGVVSVHRDLWVNTATRGATKINTLDEFGGPALVKQGLSSLLGIPIDYYVRIDFDGVIKAIDAIGGVTVDVDCPFTEYYPDSRLPGGVRTLKVPAGRVPMSGQMALDYSRSRLSSTVTDRMKRQMKILLGVREKLLSPGIFPRIPQLWDVTKNLVQTDLPPTMILPLAKLAAELNLGNARGLTVSENFSRQTYSPQGWWILVPDLNAVRANVRGIFDGKPLADSVKRAGC